MNSVSAHPEDNIPNSSSPRKISSNTTPFPGHIFGLLHEHQRFDRDNHVRLDCTKVKGYDRAVASAAKDGFTAVQLCESEHLQRTYGFLA